MLETEIQERKAQRDLVNHERILPRSRSREAERDRDHDREREERRLENERIDAELREEMRFKEQTAREECIILIGINRTEDAEAGRVASDEGSQCEGAVLAALVSGNNR
jgi:hypothetical protein